MFRRMTTNQKIMAKELQKKGICRADARIYAQNTSDFMFQTGVAYVSGVLTAATVGAARMAGHAVGWGIGKVAGGIGSAIQRKQQQLMVCQETDENPAQERRAKKAAAKAAKIRADIQKAEAETPDTTPIPEKTAKEKK